MKGEKTNEKRTRGDSGKEKGKDNRKHGDGKRQ